MKFVVEHLEPELYEWCLIEYGYISEIVGKKNLIFTNIKDRKEQNKLQKFGKVYNKKLSELDFNGICVLSQYAKKQLTKNDINKFVYFVFGGILGDNPAKKRTNEMIKNLKGKKIKFSERNLGNPQMPTDNAVYAAKRILEGGKLGDLKFADELEIQINENESVILPFRYVVDDNKAVISGKLVEYLRRREGF